MMRKKYTKLVAQLNRKQFSEYKNYLNTHAPKSLNKATISDILQTARKGVPISISEIPESFPLQAIADAAGINLPPSITVPAKKQRYVFYLVEVIFNMEFKKGVFPKNAEFMLNIEDDVNPSYRKSRPIQLFPCRKDKQLFRLDVVGSITIDAGMDISVPMSGSNILPFARVKANAIGTVKANIVIGPFSYVFRKAVIEVTGVGRQVVHWSYKLASVLGGKNMFKSYLLMKIDERATYVKMRAFLTVVPYKKKWITLRLKKHLLRRLQVSADLEVDLTRNNP